MLFTRIITAAVLIAALLAALFLLDGAKFQLVVAMIVAIAAWEWSRLAGVKAVWLSAAYVAACAAAYQGLVQAPVVIGWMLWAAAIFWAAVAPLWLSRGFLPGPGAVLIAAGLIVILPAALAMATLPPLLLLALLGISVVADTAAYFCGRAFGKRKLAREISPGKTWEGAFGGTVFCLIYATICAMLMPQIGSRVSGAGWGIYLLAVIGLCAASVLGDLLESALKRRAGAKDSGRLLPGHGGVLDRIDSATATLPIGLLMMRGAGIA